MEEDVEMSDLLDDKKRTNPELEVQIADFRKSFIGVKKVLMEFLRFYSKADTELDENFYAKFKQILEALAKRIEFEENNLYAEMKVK
jgi:hypothetical protein